MEMSTGKYRTVLVRTLMLAIFLLGGTILQAQGLKTYRIKDGHMYIMLDRSLSEPSLDSFIRQFDLKDLGLKNFLRFGNPDSVLKQGWKIVKENAAGFVISKNMEALGDLDNPVNKMILTEKSADITSRFPAVSNRVVFGVNRLKNKTFQQRDSVVSFFIRGYPKANRVYLAGSFNNWQPAAQAMKQTDSGWVAHIKLGPGKYWYKFVVDGNWVIDGDNNLREPDGEGNVNSVYYRTNTVFRLAGHTDARQVFLSGSFNGWKPKDLRMNGTGNGWELPVYLANGTHLYKFIADGNWLSDPANSQRVPDGEGDYNSVVTIGTTYTFELKGYETAKKVMLAGSFNNWRDFEFAMKRTGTGWEFPLALAPGNYEYKFLVDGKWMGDPANALTAPSGGNSYLIINPNYTFKLKGNSQASKVYVAGDFNGWNPTAYPMKRVADGWEFPLNLAAGKTRYKFIVDGKWILDPGNKLWEQNEFGTGNSVLWIDP